MEVLKTRGAGLLYPLLVVAAIAVIVFTGLGTAALLGWLPSASSAAGEGARGGAVSRPAAAAPGPGPAPGPGICADCGSVESVTPYAVKGGSGGLGAVAGGVVGGLVGNQLGNGNGRTLITIAGAGGGAYVGDQIEKSMNRQTRYRVVVRMDDGSTRSFNESDAGWQPGARVRVAGGRLAAAPR